MEKKQLSIVLVGDFNPKIYTPQWFQAQSILTQEEAESADVELIAHDFAIFEIPDKFRIEVQPQRFHMLTRQEPYFILVKDIIVATFSLLSHTPIFQMGLNLEAINKLPSEKESIAFSRKIIRPEVFGDLSKDALFMNLGWRYKRGDKYLGYIFSNIRKVENVEAIHAVVNDHYEVKGANGCETIIQVLNDEFENSLKRSHKMLEDIFGYAR